MNSETRTCQNCKQNFAIEPEDFKFYDKIKVPPPTFCPACRAQRRLAFRNERSLYNRTCDLCKKDIIAVYHKSVSFPVYCQTCWYSDNWNPSDYAMDYNFSENFFSQFRTLINKVLRLALFGENNLNSPYTNYTWNSKNVYLSPSTLFAEDILYSIFVDHSYHCVDCTRITNCEICYGSVNADKCYNSSFLVRAQNCIDSRYLFDAHNANNCFMSANIRNKQCLIKNKAYSKEDFLAALQEYDFGSYSVQSALNKEFQELKNAALHKFANIVKTVNSFGDNLSNVKNVRACFDIYESEEVAYSFRGFNLKDVMDVYACGPNCSITYDSINIGLDDSRYKFSVNCWGGNFNIEYSDLCMNSSDLFGCIGLRNKSYCILNKQYTKEEYEKLVPRIIEHMNQMPYTDQKGRVYKYGEFFPPELSPFSYNETIAQEYFPLTKEEAIEKGYSWKDSEPRNYKIQIPNDQLPDHIKDVKDDIVGQVIECQHASGSPSETSGQTAGAVCNEQCTEAYKIIPQELDFLRKMNLPLPRLCPNCRHYQRIKQRNPLKLWHRKCQCQGAKSENQVYANTADHIHHKKDESCQNEFETTYAPERPEIVYCEQCYLREVV